MENGGQVIGCSDAFYASASHLILPGRAASTGEGWENARRRGPGHDYVIVALAAAGALRDAEIDTSRFIGNAPGQVRLLSADARRADPDGGADLIPDAAWREVLPLTRVQPDTRHRFLVDGVATHVRLDVIPDGGLARLRVNGEIIPEALADLRQRWRDALPEGQRPTITEGGR
jgi:allantoicase